MTASELRKKYLDFFAQKGHKIIPSAPLVPENDPTALFNSAGMQPLVPYLLGQNHPLGKKLADVQKCLRTDDIEEVGDKVHHTFFEMLGNWSLGDYFKSEAIDLSYEFLTSSKWLNIPKEKIAVSVFEGDKDAPFDQESYDKWMSLGISPERIAKLPKKNNWWGPAGETGPCGPDTEMFVWTGKGEAPKNFDSENSDWVEVWNDVFMEYNKTSEDKFELLKQKNVDTGMGLERMLAVMNGVDDDYQTDLFLPIIKKIEEISGKKYEEDKKDFRIIADHIKAIVLILADNVEFSNLNRGYVPRKLIRRLIVRTQFLEGKQTVLLKDYLSNYVLDPLIETVINTYKNIYPEVQSSKESVKEKILNEWNKLKDQMESAYPELMKIVNKSGQTINGKDVFYLFNTLGVNPEVTEQVASKYGKTIDLNGFKLEFKMHQELSRTASAGMFKGGLADHSEITTKYHTATHLLHAALRQILGNNVKQAGSNITAERMRFDFSYPEKLTEKVLKKVEDLVNEKIKDNLKVTREEMSKKEALESGALGFFIEKYGDIVSVYTIGDSSAGSKQVFSREICGGPHVDFTGAIKSFKIIKEEGVGKGVRRIYAKVE